MHLQLDVPTRGHLHEVTDLCDGCQHSVAVLLFRKVLELRLECDDVTDGHPVLRIVDEAIHERGVRETRFFW